MKKIEINIFAWMLLLAVVAIPVWIYSQELSESEQTTVVDAANATRRYSYTEKRTVLWEDKRPLVVKEDRGSIIVKGKKGKEISVKAIKTAGADALSLARSAAAEVSVSIEVPRDMIRIMTDATQIRQDYLYAYADYILKIPPEMDITAETRDGEIAVSGIDGKVEIVTASGPVSLNALKGRVGVRTENGNVEAKKSPGIYSIETVGGDVKLFVPEEGMTEKLNITSGVGNVEISIPVGVKATIVASAGGGDIINDAEEVIIPVSLDSGDGGGKKIFRSGGGGVDININSSTGTIRFMTSAARPAIMRPSQQQ